MEIKPVMAVHTGGWSCKSQGPYLSQVDIAADADKCYAQKQAVKHKKH